MSIERSAELLRQALPLMSRQQAAWHPISYAVWFEYVARTHPALCDAVDEILARDGHLDEVTTRALYRRHLADLDPDSARRVVDGLQHVLGGLGQATGSTSGYVRRFSASLAQLAAVLDRGDTAPRMGGSPDGGPAAVPVRRLADVVAEVIADTGTMRTQLGTLRQRLDDSRREIDRLREEVRKAREDGLRDALTGLANRRGFDQALAACLLQLAPAGAETPPQAAAEAARAALEAAARGADAAPASASGAWRGPWLLLADVDHFAHIRETYGAGFGDEVLKAVAQALEAMAPAGATLARLDDQGFALLLPEADAVSAHDFAERVRLEVRRTQIRRGGREATERVTLSLGLAAHHAGDSAARLVERAGQALDQARRDGRDRVATQS